MSEPIMAIVAPAQPAVAKQAPYVGPRPFTMEDVQRGLELYGRQRDVEHLLDQLASKRIVLLYSPSGAGKTSLIQAKLVAALEADQYHVLRVVRVGLQPRRDGGAEVDCREANRYVLTTLQTLELGKPAEQRMPLAELVKLDLLTWFDRLRVPQGKFPIVIFDQFEEILTMDPTDGAAKQEFFNQVGAALRNRDRWALFAMREDFIAALDPYRNYIPTRLRETYRLDLLSESAALAAITEPAKKAGVPFNADAAHALVDELRLTRVQRPDGSTETVPGEHVEPVQLQVVCLSLWGHVTGNASAITVDQVRQFGDVDRALSAFYERSLSATSRKAHVRVGQLRRWFSHQLITSGETRGLVYRGAKDTAGLPNAAVDELERQHVIRAEPRAGGTRWYELTHDRFVQPIQVSNEVWERRDTRIKVGAVSAAVAGLLLLVLAAPVFLSQRATVEFKQLALEQVAADATASTAATATFSAQSSELAALASGSSQAAQATATTVAAATSREISRATATAQPQLVSGRFVAPGGTSVVVYTDNASAFATVVALARTPEPATAPPASPSRDTAMIEVGAQPPSSSRTSTPAATQTLAPTITPTATPTPAIDPRPTTVAIGTSVDNKPLVATRVGNGPVRVGIIGSLHGGEELPAYNLLRQFAQGLSQPGSTLASELTLFVLPTLNPDDIDTRTGFNARGVDLNRNFDAIWTAVTCGSPSGRYRSFGGCKPDSGGESPFSEPEAQAARELIVGNALDTVIVVNSGLKTVSSRNGGDGSGESLARDIEEAFHMSYVRVCCATYPVTGQLVDWAESVGVRAVEVNAPESLLQQQGLDLLKFILDRVAAPTCTPTLKTGEFALKASPGSAAHELGLIDPGEEAIVEAWSYATDTPAQAAVGLEAQDPWLLVRLSRPNDGRRGWMFTREVNNAQPQCSFKLDDPSQFRFPHM